MIEIEASSLDQALKRAELALGLEREYIRYEIDTARTSLFGTRDRRIVIRACPDQKLYHPALSPFLQSFRELSGLDVLFSFPEGVGDKDVSILVEGADSHLFDEREGELLIALQYVLNKAFGEKMGRFILLDTRNEFRQKRSRRSTPDVRYREGADSEERVFTPVKPLGPQGSPPIRLRSGYSL